MPGSSHPSCPPGPLGWRPIQWQSAPPGAPPAVKPSTSPHASAHLAAPTPSPRPLAATSVQASNPGPLHGWRPVQPAVGQQPPASGRLASGPPAPPSIPPPLLHARPGRECRGGGRGLRPGIHPHLWESTGVFTSGCSRHQPRGHGIHPHRLNSQAVRESTVDLCRAIHPRRLPSGFTLTT